MSTGVLETIVPRIRGYLDIPALAGKYDDAYVVRHGIVPSLTPVWNFLAKQGSGLVTVRHSLSTVVDQKFYDLPPVIGEIWRIAMRDATTNEVVAEAMPRGVYHPRGANWRIEGRSLSFDPPPQTALDFEIEYLPSGDFKPVQSERFIINADLDEVTIDLSDTMNTQVLDAGEPTGLIGEFDRRPQAYAGQILRLIPDSGVIEERVVESWSTEDGVEWTATLRRPLEFAEETTFTGEDPDNPMKGEFAPAAHEAVWEAIAAYAAVKLASYGRQTTTSHIQAMKDQLKSSMIAAASHFAHLQMRTPQHFERATVDNPETMLMRW